MSLPSPCLNDHGLSAPPVESRPTVRRGRCPKCQAILQLPTVPAPHAADATVVPKVPRTAWPPPLEMYWPFLIGGALFVVGLLPHLWRAPVEGARTGASQTTSKESGGSRSAANRGLASEQPSSALGTSSVGEAGMTNGASRPLTIDSPQSSSSPNTLAQREATATPMFPAGNLAEGDAQGRGAQDNTAKDALPGNTATAAQTEATTPPVAKATAALSPDDGPTAATFADALTLSRRLEQPVLVFFFADWCGWCRKMRNETLTHQAVKEAMQQFVTVILDDADPANARLKSQYQVKGLPTYVIVDSSGRMLKSGAGFHRNAHDFVDWLNDLPPLKPTPSAAEGTKPGKEVAPPPRKSNKRRAAGPERGTTAPSPMTHSIQGHRLVPRIAGLVLPQFFWA